MSNYYIQRPDYVKLGAYGAAIGAATDLGSVRSVEIAFEAETRYATSAAYNGAPVEAQIDAASGSITCVLEEMTEELFEFLTGATYASGALAVDGEGGAPTYLTAYVAAIPIDGVPHYFHAFKVMVEPSFSLSLGEEQMTVELPLRMLVDPTGQTGEKFYELVDIVGDNLGVS